MSERIKILDTTLKDLKILERKMLGDKRGFLSRLYCKKELKCVIRDKEIKQINHTFTKKKYTIRGMHFQYPPFNEIKIVSCLKGEVHDIAIDIRENSPTFMKYFSQVLSENNFKSLFIPEGFAHGFQTLTDDCMMLYFHTEFYKPNNEGGINPMEKSLSIDWPYPFSNISERDSKHPMLNNDFKGIKI